MKGCVAMLGKIFKTLLLWAVLLSAALPAGALDFELTPAGAELLRERGSVGYLHWGLYREC